MKTRAIAFYLPQYHPIPENDEWWGKGFTDWINVVRAKPLFKGHEQPRLPADLGFYDLRLPEIREAQARLAAEYGIYGFCYHHYWFGGRRILNRPLDEVLSSGKPDFPFCLNWANENWTRRWDGLGQEILLEQKYSEEDDRKHIEWLIPVLKDPRYIRVNGKPLLLIYAPQRLPDPGRTTQLWREMVDKSGIPGLYLCKVETFGNKIPPEQWGFDAAVQFPPHGTHVKSIAGNFFKCKAYRENSVYRYDELVSSELSKERPAYSFHPCVMPGWDNTPRRKMKAHIFSSSTPGLYENWLKKTVQKYETADPEKNLVFINAWNEWAEGAYLEPDQRSGRAYLEATRRALEGGKSS